MRRFLASAAPRRGKYNNVRTPYGGRSYHSRAEANFAATLDQLKRARRAEDRVVSWEPQVAFPIAVAGKPICKYVADFRVWYGDGRCVIYDVKGAVTDVYRIKKKLVEALYGIEIREVPA